MEGFTLAKKITKQRLRGGFDPYSEPTVWSDVESSGILSASETEMVIDYWKTTWALLDIDPAAEYQRIKDRQANKQAEPSIYWSQWAASNTNVLVSCRQDTSKNLHEQRNQILSREERVKDPRGLPAALMCCDRPEQTMAFIYRVFCEEHDISFGDRIQYYSDFARYVAKQMAIAFVGKKLLSIMRPSDYEQFVLRMNAASESVSKIPHPNHGSFPGGHPVVGWAAVRAAEHTFGKRGNKQWRALGTDAGWARVDLGIHWCFDIEVAFDTVDHFHELCTSVTF